TERALPNREADDVTAAAGAELRRRHPEQVGRGGVEAAIGVEAGAIDRLGDGIACGELLAHALAAMAGGIGLRGHAGYRLEHAVEVEAAHARGLRQRVETRRLLGFFDQPARTRDDGGMRLGKRRLVRPAALARPKSRSLGVRASFVEGPVLAPRQTSRAGGPAIDPGRAHRIEEGAVSRALAPLDRRPARVVFQYGRCPRRLVGSHQQRHDLAPSGSRRVSSVSWWAIYGSQDRKHSAPCSQIKDRRATRNPQPVRPIRAAQAKAGTVDHASAFIRHSPDDSETSVESSDFAASLEARREMWLATSSSRSPNDGRGVDLAIFTGI